MHLLQFLEICVGEFTLWPTYLLELLFLKDFAPKNIIKVAAFFYGHGVPLGIASRLFNICKNNKGSHLIPYLMGGYYSTFVSNKNALHMAQYYNVKEGRIIWINGYNHSQLETVSPGQIERCINCRTLNQSQIPYFSAGALCFTMQELRD
jgi:hypothetical protein